LDRRLGGPQSRSGRGGEKINSQPMPGLEPPIVQEKYINMYFRGKFSQSVESLSIVSSSGLWF